MKMTIILLTGVSAAGLMLPAAHAQDAAPVLPPLPQGYDLMTISRGPASVTPGLGPDKRNTPEATIISILPADGGKPKATIEWSGYVKTGVVYSNGNGKSDKSAGR